jgi:hypothetical protein
MIYLADPVYNPDQHDPNTITSQIKLAKGVSISTFLGYGAATLGHIGSATQRAQIARNLLLHADILNMVNGDTDFFRDVKLKVSEGLYEAGPTETIAGDNLLKSDGRMVGYQVINGFGRLDLERTFDVAVYIKDNARFKRLVLDYDTYNPDGSLTSTILVEFPTVPSTYDLTFKQDIETQYNGVLFSKNELVEVLPK